MIKLLLNGRAANSCQLREEYRLYNLLVIENDKIGDINTDREYDGHIEYGSVFLCK